MIELYPEVLKEFVASISNNHEKTPWGRAQKLVSCRRLLKDLTDFLYPLKDEPIIGSDGIERELSEENFVNRIWQFVGDSYERNTSSGWFSMGTQNE